jgi:hypothetical protein
LPLRWLVSRGAAGGGGDARSLRALAKFAIGRLQPR